MTDLTEARAKLVAQFPELPDLDLDRDGEDETGEIRRAWGAYLYFTVSHEANGIQLWVQCDLPGNNFTNSAPIDDAILRSALIAAAHQIATIPEEDEWDSAGDYGYADASFTGTDTWEDQTGMLELKKYLKIPDHWYLMKVVNFNHAKLIEMEQWLKDNCTHEYKRVGWSSSCTTKVGVAFSNMNDAFFYKLRWR